METFSYMQQPINPYTMSSDSYNSAFSAPNVHYLLSSGYPSAPSPAPYGMWTNYAPPASLRRRVVFVDEVAVISFDSSYSYEDLLEMEERMGRVNLGLSEETISKNLKTSIINYAVVDDHSQDKEGEICVVCQSEYESDETVAALHCGHSYHANCIKEWLLQKNVCPICKSTALEV